MKLAILSLLAMSLGSPASATSDWKGVDHVLGRQGADQPGGIHRYSFPRSDLAVSVDGVRIRPALALGSWLAFHDVGDHAEVVGDLVLTQEEVNPVLSRLLDGGLTITALHNHLLRSTPATMYMHVHGHGDAQRLAATLKTALSASRTPTGAAPAPTSEKLVLNTAALDRQLGAQGKSAGGTYQFSIPRREQVTQDGAVVPPALGLGTAINFQPIGGQRAVTTGDFVLVESEVTPVLRALREHGIDVTALHNHMAGEQPRLFFMHFWGKGEAAKLGTGIAAALSKMNLRRGT